jgi:uncharacterized protein (DUF1499 family)
MKTWMAILVAAGLALAGAGAVFVIQGPDRFWRQFGDPDLGAVAFETLVRRTTPNDALACPPDVCTAPSDVLPPAYALSAAQLRQAFAAVIAAEPRVTRVAADDTTLTDRYIQRTAMMGFPDTIVVRFFDRPGGRSSLALYSRSEFGRSDFGVNKARIKRWITRLGEHAPVAD